MFSGKVSNIYINNPKKKWLVDPTYKMLNEKINLEIYGCFTDYESFVKCIKSGRISNLKDVVLSFPGMGTYDKIPVYENGKEFYEVTGVFFIDDDYVLEIEPMPKKGESVAIILPRRLKDRFFIFTFDIETGKITWCKEVTKTFTEMYENGELRKGVVKKWGYEVLDTEIFEYPESQISKIGDVFWIFYEYGILDAKTLKKLFKGGECNEERGKSDEGR